MRREFSRMVLLLIMVGIVVSLSLPGAVSGTTLYVGPGETYNEIQPAINDAIDSDIIIVRDGTYTGPNNKNLYIEGKAITLKSENGPQYCIIDCEESGRGFYFYGSETNASVVDGFTIKNGYVKEGGAPYDHGGGILCEGASPTIKNCTIINNRAVRGGGIACDSYASPPITNCVISGNQTNFCYYGGAMYVYLGSPPITNCMFTDNSTGTSAFGKGTLYLKQSNAQIKNCTFSGNSAHDAGAIYIHKGHPTITNCILWNDSAYFKGPEIYVMYDEQINTNVTIQYSDIDPEDVFIVPGATVYWLEGNINTDPLFVGEGDYHLMETSLCIDVGTDAGVYTDIDGDSRPYGDGFDMGADEFAPPCYEFYGFIEPLPFEDSGEVRAFKGNRVIPVKFRLYDSFGTEITSFTEPPVISIVYAGSSDPGEDPEEYDVTGQADSGNTFRYSDENWIFNLSMRSFAIDSNYDIIVTVPETGCSHQVRIHLVK